VDTKLRKLETMPMDDLRRAFSGLGHRWTPVVNGQTLPQDPFYTEASEISKDVPTVMSSTYDETRNLVGGSRPHLFNLTWDQVPEKLEIHARQFLGDFSTKDIVRKYEQHYPDYSPSDVFFAVTTTVRSWRSFFIQADARARQNGSAALFVYYFNWKST
jgi:para-nitrobenzyl esterase